MPAIKIIVNKHTTVNIVVELNQSTFRQVTKVGGCFYELMQNSAYRPISKFVSLYFFKRVEPIPSSCETARGILFSSF